MKKLVKLFDKTGNELVPEISLKAKTIKITKKNDQVLTKNSYDNQIFWESIIENQDIADKIFLKNGICYISPKVKKVDVFFNIWTVTKPIENFQFGIGNLKISTMLNNGGDSMGNKMNWSLTNKNKSNAAINFCPYIADTIKADSMWTYAYITITYE